MDAYKVDSDDRTLVSSFEKNRGALPVPITGPYVIVGHYGQYDVPGLRNVRLDNKGIDIKGQAGANARAIFDGRDFGMYGWIIKVLTSRDRQEPMRVPSSTVKYRLFSSTTD